MRTIILFSAVALFLGACKNQKNERTPISIEPTHFTIDSSVAATPAIDLPKDTSGVGDTLLIVTGKRELSSIDNEVRQHLISVNFWYHRQFPKAKAEKRVTVAFWIDGLGVPHEGRVVSSTLPDSLFVKKIIDDIAQWRFARYPIINDTTYVVYPITLRPASQN